MMSFRAIILYTLAFVLLGCSHTLHYNYPPPHPPSQALDASSIQEPEVQPEHQSNETSTSQIQEPTQEQRQEMTREYRSLPGEPAQYTPGREDPGKPAKQAMKQNPAIRPEVKYWIERLTGKDRRTFQSQLARLDRIRPVIEDIFARNGVPADLAYLCLVESGANAHAVSCSGATGYWQFIPDTAKKFGLQVNKYVDERKNLEKSTQAAAMYLKHLYAIFGDWYLAIAAYNAGEGALARLMKNEGINTFWDIDESMAIKTETIAYVPKYIATVLIASNREAYGLPAPEKASPGSPKTIDHGGYLDTVARSSSGMKESLAQTSPEIVTDVNPTSLSELRREVRSRQRPSDTDGTDEGPSISYTVRKGDTLYSLARKHSTTVKAIAGANNISEKQRLRAGTTILIPTGTSTTQAGHEKKDHQVHRVAKGETLESIARTYGVSVQAIMLVNNIGNPRRIKAGTSLVIPRSDDKPENAGPTKYTVKKGDTLWAISRQFDVSSTDIMKWNSITSTAQIKPGDELTIYRQ